MQLYADLKVNLLIICVLVICTSILSYLRVLKWFLWSPLCLRSLSSKRISNVSRWECWFAASMVPQCSPHTKSEKCWNSWVVSVDLDLAATFVPRLRHVCATFVPRCYVCCFSAPGSCDYFAAAAPRRRLQQGNGTTHECWCPYRSHAEP